MSTQPEPDYRIAVVLATERGRTAVVALISDLTGPVDTVILERTPKHNYPQRQRRRLVLQVIGSALERIERPSTVGLMCEEEEVVKMLRSVKIAGARPGGRRSRVLATDRCGFPVPQRHPDVAEEAEAYGRPGPAGPRGRRCMAGGAPARNGRSAAGGQLGQISRNAPRGLSERLPQPLSARVNH